MANLTVTMAEEDWGKMLNLLADAPFRQVAPIITQIQRQLQLQVEQSQRDQAPPTIANKPNGAAEAHAPGA